MNVDGKRQTASLPRGETPPKGDLPFLLSLWIVRRRFRKFFNRAAEQIADGFKPFPEPLALAFFFRPLRYVDFNMRRLDEDERIPLFIRCFIDFVIAYFFGSIIKNLIFLKREL